MIMNAHSHPSLRASGGMVRGAARAPTDAPALKMDVANARSFLGKYSAVTFLKVDTDDFPELAQKFFIVSIPSMVAYKDGKRVDLSLNGNKENMQVGALQEEDFEVMLNETFAL